MSKLKFLQNYKKILSNAAFFKSKMFVGASVFFGLLLTVYGISKWLDSKSESKIYHSETKHTFDGARTVGSRKEIYERKETLLMQRLNQMEKTLAQVKEASIKAEASQNLPPTNSAQPAASPTPQTQTTPENVKVSASQQQFQTEIVNSKTTPRIGGGHLRPDPVGPALISFPVDTKSKDAQNTVVLPSGSFVRAKLLTGVEAPEGKPLPVLMQADFAFVGPNKTRIDLSGCFLIAKSTGNLSIERVEMQVSKMSCVSKSGKSFEKDISGFVADDKDNSFAVIGTVNSKQDRVAAMAFLSSVVDGIGKSIQAAQTATTVTEKGQASTNVTGDDARYILGGGASNAATMITQWYLKQAQSLLPTINVGSGQDVWLILQEGVELPNWYFKKSTQNQRSLDHVFSYLSRVHD